MVIWEGHTEKGSGLYWDKVFELLNIRNIFEGKLKTQHTHQAHRYIQPYGTPTIGEVEWKRTKKQSITVVEYLNRYSYIYLSSYSRGFGDTQNGSIDVASLKAQRIRGNTYEIKHYAIANKRGNTMAFRGYTLESDKINCN